MQFLNHKSRAITLLSAGILILASCSSKENADSSKATGETTRTVVVEPGVAGGVAEGTFTVSATVAAVDKTTRRVTLTAGEGNKSAFTAGPEVRNFDQIRVGDKVTATFNERLAVFVRGDGADPSVTHAAALGAAPIGAKPGAMVAESYEVVASVKSINSANRTAVLEFPSNQLRTVNVRPDVDLSKYKVGDSVVIRVTATLSVLVEQP
jgi:hypothetical protein